MITLSKLNFDFLMEQKDILILPFNIYLAMHDTNGNAYDLKEVILRVKNIKKRKKMKIELHEVFSQLIDDIALNFKKDELENGMYNKFALAQTYLSSTLVQWIDIKKEIKLNKKEIKNTLDLILKFIRNYYGNYYINIMSIIGLYNEKEIGKSEPSSVEIMKSIANIIKNILPSDFDGTMSSYYMNNYKEISQYKIEFPKIESSNEPYAKLFRNILSNLIIVKSMKKYKIKSRLNFFSEIMGQNHFLPEINNILTKTGKKKLINLNNIYEDEELVKEKMVLLTAKLNESNKNNNKMIDKLNKLEDTITSLQAEIASLKSKFQKSQEMNNNLLNEISALSQDLSISETKRNNYYYRESCKNIEEYFYHIISINGRNEIQNSFYAKKGTLIDLICNKIKDEYPLTFGNIKKSGIDWIGFLLKVNTFRKENNSEIHDKTKLNISSLIATLNNYFNNGFDFEKPMKFFINNFYNFKTCIFNDDGYGEEISKVFQEKENAMK